MRSKRFILLLILIVSITLAGCGSGGSHSSSKLASTVMPTYPTGETSCTELYGGTDLGISAFDTQHIYTINSAVPPTKPESDGSSQSYSYSISSVAGSSPTQSRAITASSLNTASPSTSSRFPGQTHLDLQLRERENDLLQKRLPLVNNSIKLMASVPSSINKGTAWNNVNIYLDSDNIKKINTTCDYISNHAYFFVDTRDSATIDPFLRDYGTKFDQIYLTDRTHFGTENDVDKNGKIIIIFSQALESSSNPSSSMLGFFNAADKFAYNSKSNPYSNNGDIIYVTSDPSAQEDKGDYILATMAHEFQHMIYFDQHYNRNVTYTYTWLNEALSQAAEYYNGYLDNHNGWINSFLSNDQYGGWGLGLSLTQWTEQNYGYGAVFIHYLIDQYGDTAIYNMCSTNKNGIAAVEAATGADFNTIFVNFTRALVLSGISANPKYNFTSINLKTLQPNGRGGLIPSSPPTPYTAGATDSGSLRPYEIRFDRWTGSFQTMKLTGTYEEGTVFGLSN